MKWTGYAKRARTSVPLSALEFLCFNRQIHDEVFKLFYRNNDLVFSEPVQLQDFVMSISIERLENLRSVTLFCKQYGPADGASVTDAALCSLRCLRGPRNCIYFYRQANINIATGNFRGLCQVSRCSCRSDVF